MCVVSKYVRSRSQYRYLKFVSSIILNLVNVQVKDLEVKIDSLKHSQHIPTQTEIEFEAHLAQLTDHIIQKQAQVDTLCILIVWKPRFQTGLIFFRFRWKLFLQRRLHC